VKRIRDEKKFDSAAELTDQMDRDVEAARAILADTVLNGQ